METVALLTEYRVMNIFEKYVVFVAAVTFLSAYWVFAVFGCPLYLTVDGQPHTIQWGTP